MLTDISPHEEHSLLSCLELGLTSNINVWDSQVSSDSGNKFLIYPRRLARGLDFSSNVDSQNHVSTDILPWSGRDSRPFASPERLVTAVFHRELKDLGPIDV